MKQKSGTTRIAAPYESDKERLRYLQDVIVEGKDAEAVMKYAERLLSNIEGELLEKLAKPSANLEEAAMLYRVALKFYDLVAFAVNEAERKTDTFHELRTQQLKEV